MQVDDAFHRRVDAFGESDAAEGGLT
jgi:hypothetical protein